MRGKGTGNKKQAQNRQGEGKNSIGNGEAKQLICMTPGRQLRECNVGGGGSAEQKERKGRKQLGLL